VAKRWSCVEADCHYVVTAPDEVTIVTLAQEHIAEVHASFELEEMIEAVLEDVPEQDA
jgi:hypothetical protein